MSSIIELNDIEIKESVERLYKSFDNGYEFELFLKYFLERIGLEEVVVTQKSKDGGIDLTCTKAGINGLSNLDEIKYYVQAKCYKPDSTIPIQDIRELRGVMPINYKGIFITTAKFPPKAKEFAEGDPTRQIILIDGKMLVQQCITSGIGFNLKPVFDEKTLKHLLSKPLSPIITTNEIKANNNSEIVVSKNITLNDIRARILRIPNEIVKEIPTEEKQLEIIINNKKYILNINANRSYLGGVTQLYKSEGLITDNNVFVPKKVIWHYLDGVIRLEIENEE